VVRDERAYSRYVARKASVGYYGSAIELVMHVVAVVSGMTHRAHGDDEKLAVFVTAQRDTGSHGIGGLHGETSVPDCAGEDTGGTMVTNDARR
jgi:hypothetical protein